jgi:hypothetical protein
MTSRPFVDIPRALGCEPNFLRGPLPRRISRMRGEIAAGNVSCGMGAGVPSIEVTANAAELKNASRMFRPNAVSKSRTGISNFPFGSGYVVTAHPPAVSAPLRTLARVAGFELGGYAVAVAPVGDSALLDDRSEGLGGRRSLGLAFNSRRLSALCRFMMCLPQPSPHLSRG